MNEYPFYKPLEKNTYTVGSLDTLHLPKYGDIKLAEKVYVKEKLESLNDSTTIVASLATKVARAKAIPPKLAASIIWGMDDESTKKELKALKLKLDPQGVREEFYLEITEATKSLSKYAEARRIACAEALIQYRLTKDIAQTKEIMNDISDTLLQELAEFWEKEESHWATPGK